MKKIYQIPTITVVFTAQSLPIATSDGSLQKTGDNYTGSLKNENASGAGLVKDAQDYNVWNDDWSN